AAAPPPVSPSADETRSVPPTASQFPGVAPTRSSDSECIAYTRSLWANYRKARHRERADQPIRLRPQPRQVLHHTASQGAKVVAPLQSTDDAPLAVGLGNLNQSPRHT